MPSVSDLSLIDLRSQDSQSQDSQGPRLESVSDRPIPRALVPRRTQFLRLALSCGRGGRERSSRSPSCRTTSFSDAATTQPVGPVGADSEREGLRSTTMANIYGGTTDGLDASYDVASFVAFAKTRPLLSGIL
eukprot:COSAG06_NODE_22922_length_708_cov_3.256158_1_plen_132_part_10